MNTKVVKSRFKPEFMDWIKENNYSINSPKHRGYYAEMIFRKYVISEGITAVKINSHFNILEQIPAYFLKKLQAKELEKLGKINLDFFCFGKEKGYFVVIKMGTSNLSRDQKELVSEMKRNKVFLFRIFEDADIFIKELN